MEREYKYDAFISYRHLNPDKDIADKLQRMLESYTPPKALRGEGKWKKWHIFRDETELPTSSNLGDDIKNALDNSNFLIVICSPKTAESRWCMEEIEYFKKIHNGNNAKIITVVASGTPEEAFPDELCKELVEVMDDEGNATYEERIIEPLAANVASENTKDAIKKLKEEFLRVVAPMLGCGYDDLYNREQKKKTKRIIISSLCAIFAFALFSIYNGIMLYRINLKNQELEEANYNLQVEKSEVAVAQAETMLDLGNSYEAIKYAYEAIPKGGAEYPAVNKAERILTDAMGVYTTGKKVQRTTSVKVSEYVNYLASTEDGRRIIVKDENATVYLIDTAKKEIVKTFTEHGTFHSASGRIDDIIVSGNTFYMMKADKFVMNSLLVSANAEDGSENWRCETIAPATLVTNDSVDFLCVAGNEEYSFIDKKSGKVIKEGKFAEYVNANYYYMASDGTVYIIESDYNIKGNEMHIIRRDSYKQAELGLGTEYEILSMGESEDAVYINIGKGNSLYFDEAELICIEKNSDEIKWKTSYPTDEAAQYGYHKIFPLKHEIKKSKTDDTMIEVDGIAVVTDNAVYMFDKETGDRYAGRELSGDVADIIGAGDEKILACGKSSEKSKISMITDKLFYHSVSFSTYGYSGGRILGYYLPADNAMLAVLLNGGYAFCESFSPEVTIVDYVECDRFMEIPEFKTNNRTRLIKDSENGIIVAEVNVYDEEEGYNLITIYDGEKITGTVKLNEMIHADYIWIFDDRVVVAGDKKLILCGFEGEFLDELILEDALKEFSGDEYAYTGVVQAIACDEDRIFIATSGDKIVIMDILEDKFEIKEATECSTIGKSYVTDKSIEFVAQYNEKNESFCKIANISASGISFVKKDGEDYVFANDGKDNSANNLITCVTYSGEAKMAAFSDIRGFIGIYRDGEDSFSEIKYDSLEYTVDSMAFSKDGKYLFAIMKGGRIVKYSVENLSAVSENEIDIAGNMNLKELCENTLILSDSYNHKVISEETLEIKAEISGYISHDGSRFYKNKKVGEIYQIGYNKYLTREELLSKAEEFLS